MKILMPEHTKYDMEIGDKFLNTHWTICGQWWDERDKGGTLRTYVPVRCDCGTEQRGRFDRLHSKNVNSAPWSTRCRKCSAGGKKREMDTLWHNTAKTIDEIPQNKVNDLSGLFFGDIYVIRRIGTNKGSHSLYECQCSCGNIEIITDTELKREGKCVCSKCANNISQGAKFIKNILDTNKIKYQMEYSFEDLKGDDKALRFDFAILSSNNQPKILIEFQGKQHYEPIEYFGGKEKFDKQVKYDNKKRDYCRKNHYMLLEIPYTMPAEDIKKLLIDII